MTKISVGFTIVISWHVLRPGSEVVKYLCKMLKVKVEVYSPISNLKNYHPTLHFIVWSLNLLVCVPIQLHGEHKVLQPFQCIELIIHCHCHLCPTRYSFSSVAYEGEVPFPRTQHRKNVSIVRGEKHSAIHVPLTKNSALCRCEMNNILMMTWGAR